MNEIERATHLLNEYEKQKRFHAEEYCSEKADLERDLKDCGLDYHNLFDDTDIEHDWGLGFMMNAQENLLDESVVVRALKLYIAVLKG